MEFFVGSGAFSSVFQSGAGLTSAPELSFGRGFVVGTNEPYKTHRSTCFAFGGARLTEDSFLSHWNVAEAPSEEVFAHYENRDTDFSLGVFALLSWSDEEWELTLDKLAQYSIFIWKKNEEYLICNSLELMTRVLHLSGMAVERSVRNTVEALVYGTTFGCETGFEGITLYRSPKASFKNGHLFVEDGEFVGDLYAAGGDKSYSELLDDTTHFLARAGQNISLESFGGNLLTDLTGGVDSRLTLSILLSSGLDSSDISIFCLGGELKADRIVADYLLEQYGLSPGTFFTAKSPEGVGPADFIERGVYRFYGMKLADYGDFGDGKVVGQTKVTGYYGELARLFYDFKFMDNEALADEFVSVGGLDQYISSEVVSGLRSKMLAFFNKLDGFGLSFDDKLHALYLLNRNKIHCGMSAHLAEKTRQAFHPLNSALFVKLSLLLDREQRKANRVAFDIIGRLNPSLLMEPMAEKTWANVLFPAGFDFESYRERCFINNGDHPISVDRYKYGQKNLLHRKAPRVYEDKEFSDRMRKLGVQYHWALLPDLKVRVEKYLDQIEGSSTSDSVFKMINVDSVRSLLRRLDFSATSHKKVGPSNIEAKFLLKLLSALSWLSNSGVTPTVDYVFDVRKR